MFRFMLALPLIATFLLPFPTWSSPTPADLDNDSVHVKGGYVGDPSG